MGKNYYYVRVETLKGDIIDFQLPNDLQAGMRAYRHKHPQDWEELFRDALINIPSSAYTKANNYQPMIRLACIRKVFTQKKQQRRRSRGQFLTRENWSQRGVIHFFESARFIQHDYSRWNQCVLLCDYARWRYRFRIKK